MSDHNAAENPSSVTANALASVRNRFAAASTPGHLATLARDADETARVLEADSKAAEKCREAAATARARTERLITAT